MRGDSMKRRSRAARRWQAFTLVEMLVAVAVSLVIILAMVQVFQVVGSNVSTGRAILEMQGQLRVVAVRLQQDLEGVTVPVRPWPDTFAAQGYFEYVEGVGRDWNPYDWTVTPAVVATANPTLGDYDDYLMFTSRTSGAPFVGQLDLRPWDAIPPQPIESKLAEIQWWAMPIDENQNGVADEFENVRIHRRAWLIRPDLNQTVTDPTGSITVHNAVAVFLAANAVDLRNNVVTWLDTNDVSVHVELDPSGAIKLVANSLADLTQRQNRMAHWRVTIEQGVAGDLRTPDPSTIATGTNTFPYPLQRNPTFAMFGSGFATVNRASTSIDQLALGDTLTNNLVREGQDVILSNALSFDVQVYDPTAPLRGDAGVAANATEALTPADMGWYVADPSDNNLLGLGAYVDLAYQPGSGFFFSNLPAVRSPLTVWPGAPTYCTWSLHYEKDGVNQDNDSFVVNMTTLPLVDEGTDGVDNDGVNGVDDVGERETVPPYAGPLRGIRVRVRMIEPNTRQVRQIDVRSDFTPE